MESLQRELHGGECAIAWVDRPCSEQGGGQSIRDRPTPAGRERARWRGGRWVHAPRDQAVSVDSGCERCAVGPSAAQRARDTAADRANILSSPDVEYELVRPQKSVQIAADLH